MRTEYTSQRKISPAVNASTHALILVTVTPVVEFNPQKHREKQRNVGVFEADFSHFSLIH